jgi:glycerate 2-kinase
LPPEEAPRQRYPLAQEARDLFHAGLAAVDGGEAIRKHVRLLGGVPQIGGEPCPLGREGRIRVIGGGKAAAAMAAALEEALEGKPEGGLVAVKEGHRAPTARVEIREAGHPVPDLRSVAAAEGVLEIARRAREGDLVIALLAGGASALLTLPVEPVTLEEKQAVTDRLLRAGAAIGELNVVRKHLSRIKGGRLARAAAPARAAALVLSDVIGDRIDVIASGPMAPDPSTYGEALAVLDRYDPEGSLPDAVRSFLRGGAAGGVPETPKPGDPSLGEVRHVIVGRNEDALLAVRAAAEGMGYRTWMPPSQVEGEAREVARAHAAMARWVQTSGRPVPRPACLLSGGETTVTVRGRGRGGRNTESALAFALAAEGLENVVGLFAGTDGTDGPTDAAGALADGGTVARARRRGLDARAFLEENDSYTFFREAGGLFVTGPTLTNVMDLRIVLVR